MTPAVADLVERLRARGVELVAARDRLRFRPADALTADELDALRRHKTEVLALLTPPRPFILDPTTVREVLGPAADDPHAVAAPAMPLLTREALTTFAAEGDAVGVRCPWCPTVLWWAPNAAEAQKLIAWGIATPGAVWTATELEALIGLAGPYARAVVLAKLAVDGAVVETRSR